METILSLFPTFEYWPEVRTVLSTIVGSFIGTMIGIFVSRKLWPWKLDTADDSHIASLSRIDLKDEEQRAIVSKLDVDGFLKRWPPPDEMDLSEDKRREFALLNLHIVRANAPVFTVFEKTASQKWLHEFERNGGMAPEPPEGEGVKPTPIKPESAP